MTRVPLAQLISASEPYDFVVAGDAPAYADLASPEGLQSIARYADGVGVVRDLLVHTCTLRGENTFLPADLRPGAIPQRWVT
jgi:glycerophosphoryl diester phosphodiesterase